MKKCINCGQEINENANFCPNCGCNVDLNYNQYINQNYNQYQNQYNNSGYYNAYQQPNNMKNPVADIPNGWICVLAFLMPFVGLIISLANQDDTPIASKKYMKWTVIGVLVKIFLLTIATILYVIFFKDLMRELFDPAHYA